MVTITGADVYANYGFETTYGTPVTADKAFGRKTVFTNTDNNTLERVFQLGSQDIQEIIYLQYEATLALDFRLNTPSWLLSIMGAVADSGAGPFLHTYTFANIPKSMTVEVGRDLATDEVETYEGFQPDTATIRGAVDAPIECNLTGPYQTVVNDATLGSQAAVADDTFTFVDGDVTKGGASIARVQNFEFITTRNVELIRGLGSRFATDRILKERFTELSLTMTFEDASDFLDEFYGAAAGPIDIVLFSINHQFHGFSSRCCYCTEGFFL